MNEDLEATSSLIMPLIDILDNDEKKRELLETFNGFKIEVPNILYCSIF